MGDVVDKSERFQHSNLLAKPEWVVTIEVTVDWNFIKCVALAWWRKVPLNIRHNFIDNPLERKDL